MPFWEQHKHAFIVLGALAGMMFLSWLFVIWGHASEVESALKTYEDAEKRRQELCPEQGAKLGHLKIRYERANARLADRIAALKTRLHYDYAEAVIPPEKMNYRQQYVRTQRRNLNDHILQMVSRRKIAMEPNVAWAGFDAAIGDNTDERLEDDQRWLKQMVTVQRVVDLLLSVYEEKDKTNNILEIHSILPLHPVKGAPPMDFILEYAVEMDLSMRLKGLLRLLEQCRKGKHYHIVQNLQIVSTPSDRVSRPLNNQEMAKAAGRKDYDTWYGHYYRVRITLSAVLLSDPSQAKSGKQPAKKGPPKLIGH